MKNDNIENWEFDDCEFQICREKITESRAFWAFIGFLIGAGSISTIAFWCVL